jgi:hypothetical protein
VFADACVGAFLLHGRDVACLIVNHALIGAVFLGLEKEFSEGVEVIGVGLSGSFHC